MEKRKKAYIDPVKFDAFAFEEFMQEAENLHLARFENGEMIYEEENETTLQMVMNKYFPDVKL